MSRAGHAAYATTRRYIDLAGVSFRAEADREEERLWGASGTKFRYQEQFRWQRRKQPKPQTRLLKAEGQGFEPWRRLHA